MSEKSSSDSVTPPWNLNINCSKKTFMFAKEKFTGKTKKEGMNLFFELRFTKRVEKPTPVAFFAMTNKLQAWSGVDNIQISVIIFLKKNTQAQLLSKIGKKPQIEN